MKIMCFGTPSAAAVSVFSSASLITNSRSRAPGNAENFGTVLIMPHSCELKRAAKDSQGHVHRGNCEIIFPWQPAQMGKRVIYIADTDRVRDNLQKLSSFVMCR